MSPLRIEQPATGAGAGKNAFLALGFRPFYLFGAAFAGVAAPAWMAQVFGWIDAPRLNLLWHMHEMVYGFVVAIVIGFLYTAGRNWTGLWTPRATALAALVALWLAGRVALLAAPPLVAAAIDLAFLPLATLPLYRVIRRAGNTRNLSMVALLAALALANAAFHASALGLAPALTPFSPLQPLYFALAAIVVMEAILGGRVIPNFTANAVPGMRPSRYPDLELASLLLTIGAGLAWACAPGSLLQALLCIAAALAQSLRLAGWKPWCTLGRPLLWILHLSYAWIPAGFLLLAAACFGLVPGSAGVHLLGLGAMGGLIIGMITRSALGHTGRALEAGRSEVAMYVLLQVGVLARVTAALAVGSDLLRDGGLLLAMVCWSLAFGLYCVVYGPRLVRARVDGKEG